MAQITATSIKNAIPSDALARSGKVPPLVAGAIDHLVDQVRQHPDTEQTLTAAQRGPAWIAEYECTPWCVMQHDGEDGAPGWHQGPTAAVTAPSRLFQIPNRAGDESVVLAARINQATQDADAYGLETEIWLDVDTETLPMSVPQFRAVVAGLRRILPELEAMADEAERLSVGDHPGDPAIRARKKAELDARIAAIDAERLARVGE